MLSSKCSVFVRLVVSVACDSGLRQTAEMKAQSISTDAFSSESVRVCFCHTLIIAAVSGISNLY